MGDIVCSLRRRPAAERGVYGVERTRNKKRAGMGRRKRLEKESARLSPAFVRGVLAGARSHATDALMDATRTRSERLHALFSNHHIPPPRHSPPSASHCALLLPKTRGIRPHAAFCPTFSTVVCRLLTVARPEIQVVDNHRRSASHSRSLSSDAHWRSVKSFDRSFTCLPSFI